jgi:hypothetical protein
MNESTKQSRIQRDQSEERKEGNVSESPKALVCLSQVCFSILVPCLNLSLYFIKKRFHGIFRIWRMNQMRVLTWFQGGRYPLTRQFLCHLHPTNLVPAAQELVGLLSFSRIDN